MISGDKRALDVFVTDVEQTCTHIANRVEASKEEAAALGAGEQIQLVAENPETVITFNVPDGPPPEDLRLEGEGTEHLDVEEVRRMLQLRWDLFQDFSPEMQEALKFNDLTKINKVLGNMSIEEAEVTVNKLNMGGILSFADDAIRDETGKDTTAATTTASGPDIN
jgi:cell division cycle protein 37